VWLVPAAGAAGILGLFAWRFAPGRPSEVARVQA